MIVGKSLTALGGDGLKPEIIVTAKAGALLNLHYKGSSIILKSYQLGESETQHTFVVSVSETAYVVEDVTNSSSIEVLVDAVAQYSVEIEYILWLYKDGDSCIEVTGDWSATDKGALTTFTKNTNYMTFTMNNWSSGQMAEHTLYVQTASTIDLLSYSKIILQGSSFFGNTSSCPYCRLYAGGADKQFVLVGSATTFEIEIPVSEMTTNSFVSIEAYYASFNINKIWLE